jgi:hypothetical protein
MMKLMEAVTLTVNGQELEFVMPCDFLAAAERRSKS